MNPHLVLQAWWSKTATRMVTRQTTDEEIAALEARYDISIPADFREYLKGPTPHANNWDDELGNWWPIDRIKNIPDELENPIKTDAIKNPAKHLVFLDYMQWCWAWAISCADDETWGKVALIGTFSDKYVANSFAEFVERYTTDWDSISELTPPPGPPESS